MMEKIICQQYIEPPRPLLRRVHPSLQKGGEIFVVGCFNRINYNNPADRKNPSEPTHNPQARGRSN
jgi:hypothetical protein